MNDAFACREPAELCRPPRATGACSGGSDKSAGWNLNLSGNCVHHASSCVDFASSAIGVFAVSLYSDPTTRQSEPPHTMNPEKGEKR